MRAVISRWGNSLAVRIPKSAVEAANLHEGDSVTITEDAGGLRIAHDNRVDISELISRVTPGNLNRDETWVAAKSRGAEW